MSDLFPMARQIRRKFESIFPTMDELCRMTCPHCTDTCCRHAWVWADFKDLLFLHLTDIIVPERQLLQQRNDICRYESPAGCRLDRLQRPFVCTWYLCPAQKRELEKGTAENKIVIATLQEIKRLRKEMEISFIEALVPW